MILEGVGIDYESIDNCLNDLSEPYIIKSVKDYKANFEQILASLALPLLLVGFSQNNLKRQFYFLEGLIVTNNVGKEETVKAKKEINEYVKWKLKKEKNEIIKDAKKEISHLRKKITLLDKAYISLGLNAIVNSWTIFEAAIKDVWKYTLNNYSKKFIFNILDTDSIDIERISGKNVSIGLLAKYDFNVSNHLGEILIKKFDFTSVKGIKISLHDLLKTNPKELDFLNNNDINQLEIIRHIIVHNAGKIDNEYLKRTKRKNEKIGQTISLTGKELSNLCNSAIYAGIDIFRLIDKKIKN